MDGPHRVPPRFVPTLTTVVQLDAEPAPIESPAAPAPRAAPEHAVLAADATAFEPRFTVPAEKVDPAEALAPAAQPAQDMGRAVEAQQEPESEPELDLAQATGHSGAASDAFKALSPIHEADAFRLEEELLHRVLQRIDLSLEERLTEVVSTTVQQQLDAMVPRLRQQMESALRQLVVEAMAHELLENPGSATGSGASSLG